MGGAGGRVMDDAQLKGIGQIVASLRDGTGEPVWEPLERFCKTALHNSAYAGQFMFMGAALGTKGDRIIYLYKHGMTRRYLCLDEELITYRYVGDAAGATGFDNPIYQRTNVNRVIAQLELDTLPALGADAETPYDDSYRAKRDAALRTAGWKVIS